VDIEDAAVVGDLEHEYLLRRYLYVQLEQVIGVAVVCVDHEVGAHLVQCEHDSAYLHFGHTMLLQRRPDKIADALEIGEAATDVILIIHPPIALLRPGCRGYAISPPVPGS